MPDFYVTFGVKYANVKHPRFADAHPDGWVTIEADNENAARVYAVNWLGTAWSFLYDTEPDREVFPRGELHRVQAIAPPKIKARIPDLAFRCPDCPLCGTETSAMDGCFDCESCYLTWFKDGSGGERLNADLPPCVAERSPWAEQAAYPHLQLVRFRCVLDEGHDLPHRGVRIDQPDCENDTHEWSDSDEATTVSQ